MSDYLSLLMFPALLTALFLGFPVAFSMMGVAFFFGLMVFGDAVIFQMVQKVNDVASNFILAAVPLFVFMGAMLERSGIAEQLFEAVHLWTRRLPGGLALGTIIMCVIFAASTGVIGATETVVGLLAIPVMMKYGYDKGLISGTICAGGSLGTIIPPSVVVVVMGPVADVSVGDLFVGMFFPGLLMAGLYLVYILIRCTIDPKAGPRLPRQADEPPFVQKLRITVVALVPPVAMIFAVLGSIVLGWAAPTEAAGIGALGSILLTLVYRSFTLGVLREALIRTLKVTCMIMVILLGGSMFAGVFVAAGGVALANGIGPVHTAQLLGDGTAVSGGRLHRRVLPGLDLRAVDLHPGVHPVGHRVRIRPRLVLRPVPDRHPDQLPHAADGAGDLLPERHQPAGDHPYADVQGGYPRSSCCSSSPWPALPRIRRWFCGCRPRSSGSSSIGMADIDGGTRSDVLVIYQNGMYHQGPVRGAGKTVPR